MIKNTVGSNVVGMGFFRGLNTKELSHIVNAMFNSDYEHPHAYFNAALDLVMSRVNTASKRF